MHFGHKPPFVLRHLPSASIYELATLESREVVGRGGITPEPIVMVRRIRLRYTTL